MGIVLAFDYGLRRIGAAERAAWAPYMDDPIEFRA